MPSMAQDARVRPGRLVKGMLVDLLMAVMDSPTVWTAAAGSPDRGLAWRDAVTASMIRSASYVSFEDLVATAALALDLPSRANDDLFDAWRDIRPWPDSRAIADLGLPYAFVTNTSTALARIAAERSGLTPNAVITAEGVGWFKPHPRIYEAGCQALGVSPKDVLYVAGSAFDAIGARRFGLRTVFVGRRPDQVTNDPAIRTVGSMRDVAIDT